MFPGKRNEELQKQPQKDFQSKKCFLQKDNIFDLERGLGKDAEEHKDNDKSVKNRNPSSSYSRVYTYYTYY